MTNLELLDAQNHRHLRMRSNGATVPHFVQIIAGEFATAAASCPVLFSKDASTGSFYAGAMFGFKPGESFLQDVINRGGFSPLHLQRDGFFISGEHIAIDRDNPRFSETDGEPLFDEALRPSVRLRQIQRVLGQLQAEIETTNGFIQTLVDLRLIEPIDVSVSFDGGEVMTLRGLYTVSLDAMREIDDAAAIRLFRSGHLQLAYIMSASLKQIALLAHLRNRRIADAK
jgi:SapC